MAHDILCPYTLELDREKFPPKNPLTWKKWKKPQEKQQRRDPSPRTDRHAIDLVCTVAVCVREQITKRYSNPVCMKQRHELVCLHQPWIKRT